MFIKALEANFGFTFSNTGMTLDFFPFITEANFVFLNCLRGRSYVAPHQLMHESEGQTLIPSSTISWVICIAKHLRVIV